MSAHQLPDALPDNINEQLIIRDDERSFLEKCLVHNIKGREKLTFPWQQPDGFEGAEEGPMLLSSITGEKQRMVLRLHATSAMRWRSR